MPETVKAYFTQSIQTKISAAELLAPQMSESAQLITQTLLRDRKIFLCGSAHCSHIAQIMATQLLQHHEIHRPALPVIYLEQTLVNSEINVDPEESLSRPLQALGQPGDLLIILAAQSTPTELLKAATTAQSKDMRMLTLCGNDAFQGKLSANDIEVTIPCTTHTHTLEVLLTLTNYLTEIVNRTLFPQQEHVI